MSLRLRLTLTYSCLVGLILVVFSAVLLITMREALRTEMDRRLSVRASQAQLTIWPGTTSLTAEDLTSARLNLAPLAALNAPNVYVQVVGRDGAVIAVSDNLKDAVLPTDPSSLADALAGHTVFGSVTGDEDVTIRTLNVPISVEGNVVGVLQVGQSRQILQETMARLQLVVQIIGAASLLVAGLVGWFAAHRGLQPLSIISARAASITEQRDFAQRLQLGDRKDEVGGLARTIDKLLATIDDTLRVHREFLADTSHELRNPLLAIRTNLDLLSRVEDPEAIAECVSEARQQVDRMSRLVADLLLARVEAGELIERQPVELHQLVEATRREAKRRSRGQIIEVRSVEPIEILGDAGRLAQVLANLVDNALKHTPPDGTVSLDLQRENAWARITVADTGEGIGEEHLPHLFERFYRATPRVQAPDGGAGLGLAIAKHLTEAHGGRVTAESSPGQGSRFTVWLPLEPARH